MRSSFSCIRDLSSSSFFRARSAYSSLSHFFLKSVSPALVPYAPAFSAMVVRVCVSHMINCTARKLLITQPLKLSSLFPCCVYNMDSGDPTPLATSFPLPFRALFLIGLGILGWATNLHGLHLLGIDAPSILELQSGRGFLPTSSSPSRAFPSVRASYTSIYRLFAGYSTWCFLGWSFFRLATNSNVMLVDSFKYIPALSSLGVLITLICPYEICKKRERDAFLQ